MPEWLNGRDWKSRIVKWLSRVRIPDSPPMKTKTLLILFIIFIVVTSAGLYYWRELSLEKNRQLEEAANLSDWSQKPPHFDIPEQLDAEYISAQDWKIEIYDQEDQYPSDFEVFDGQVDCQETPPEDSFPGRMSKTLINNKVYCIKAFSEGAAGSVFTEYAYATVINNNLVIVNFVARYPQCPNYDDPQRTECEQERETFNLDLVVDQILQSAQS